MSGLPLILADAARAEQFLLIGRTRSLLDGYTVHTDRDGVVWAVKAVGNQTFAVTWLGSAWVFDPIAQERRAEKLNGSCKAMRDSGREQHERELASVVAALRLGPIAERVLWLIHQQVLRHRTSLLRLPDVLLAEAIWGSNKRPTHWRKEIIGALQSLTWIHVTTEGSGALDQLGVGTALLTHVADLRGTVSDVCGEHCQLQDARGHHHYLVNVGRGFLGVLEKFARDDDGGIRAYAFPLQGRSRRQSASLRSVGKTGQLVTAYLPAKLGDPDVCKGLTLNQHRLLQAIVRETTRNTQSERESVSEAEILQGNMIPTINGKGSIQCPLLAAEGSFVGFNGNKLLKGRGYLIASSGGWMAKAGYALDEVDVFLNDLDELARQLGLVVVGINGSNRCLAITQIAGLSSLKKVHLRVYSSSDYIERWNELFGWSGGNDEILAAETDPAAIVMSAINRGVVSQADLAKCIGMDRSFLSKVLRGKKAWPKASLDRAMAWLEDRVGRRRDDASLVVKAGSVLSDDDMLVN